MAESTRGERGAPVWGTTDILGPQHPGLSSLLSLAGVSACSCVVHSPLTLRVPGPLLSPHFSLRQGRLRPGFSALGSVLRLLGTCPALHLTHPCSPCPASWGLPVVPELQGPASRHRSPSPLSGACHRGTLGNDLASLASVSLFRRVGEQFCSCGV